MEKEAIRNAMENCSWVVHKPSERFGRIYEYCIGGTVKYVKVAAFSGPDIICKAEELELAD